MKKNTILLTVLKILIFNFSFGQAPIIEWQKCFGGNEIDSPNLIQHTSDGGYIVAGPTASNDGDVVGNHGGTDIWILKLNSIGQIEWQKCLGGQDDELYFSIKQTLDGGFIFVCTTKSIDVIGHHGDFDIWVVKLNTLGDFEWQKCLGGSSLEENPSIQQTSDGGYIVSCDTYSFDGDVSGSHGYDIWLVKLNSSGLIEWQKCLGGTSGEYASSIQQTSDGGYIVSCSTYSNDGDVLGNHQCDNCVTSDFWVVKLNSTGIIEWQKCLGGYLSDNPKFIQQTLDGGFIVAGETQSNDGDVSGYHGGIDYWILKLNPIGQIEWQTCLGGSLDEYIYSMQQTLDGGFIVAGYTSSNDGDVFGYHATLDFLILKLNSNGIIEWQNCLGGTSLEYNYSVQQTTDGGYIVAGMTESNDGDVSGNHGGFDIWLVKLNSSGLIEWQKCLGGTYTEQVQFFQIGNKFCIQTNDGGYIVAGSTNSNDGDVSGNYGGFDIWVVKLQSISSINQLEFDSPTKTLINVYDLMGRISEPVPNQLMIYLYDDGSVEKKIVME